jgi:hypothetical protein
MIEFEIKPYAGEYLKVLRTEFNSPDSGLPPRNTKGFSIHESELDTLIMKLREYADKR